MSRIRVLDLAKELNLDTKTALAKLGEVGVQVKNHFNALSDAEADKLRSYLKSGKSPADKDAAKSSSKVIIRRRAESAGAGLPEAVELSEDSKSASTPVQAEEKLRKDEQPSAPLPFKIDIDTSAKTVVSNPAVPKESSTEVLKADSPATASADRSPQRSGASSDLDATSSTQSRDPKKAEETRVVATSTVTAANQPSVSELSTEPTSATLAAEPTKRLPVSSIVRPLNEDAFRGSADSDNARPVAKPIVVSSTIAQSSNEQLTSPVSENSGQVASPTPIVGATVISRPPPATAGSGATIIRQGPATNASPIGATIIRKGEAPPQGVGPGGTGGVSTYRPENRGPIGYRSDGIRPSPQIGSGPRPYVGGGEGGIRRNDDPGAQMRGGFGGSGPRPAIGGAPRPGGSPFPTSPRPAGGGFGAPRPGGIGAGGSGGFGGPRPSTFGGLPPAPEPGTGKEVVGRPREKEKEVEQRKRKLQEEEESRRMRGPTKGRTVEGEFVEEFDEAIIDEATGEAIPLVRTMIPNRRKTGGRKRDHKKVDPQPMRQSKRVVEFDESITVNDLAASMSVKTSAVIKALMGLGMMAGVNQALDVETASLVSAEFGFEVQNRTITIGAILNTKKTSVTDTSLIESITRPPVVTIMGHVDHGKTSLLDSIRSANVAKGEAGGITQHIGAYQVVYNDRAITFLDTPGHEAFTQMRARGAQVTDVVVLVVAADDGVMPQTIEAIAHAKAAGVPIVVAINKIDKDGASPERIQRELAQHNVTPEEWGGDSMFVPVSAKSKQGIPELLEAILLQADVLDLKAAANGLASGFVIEAKLDKSRGPVATVLVTQGTLKQQDWIVAGVSTGRIRAMFDDKGQRIAEAGPATPVEVLGLADVPAAGDTFNCVVNDTIAKEAVAFRIEKQRQKELAARQINSVQEIMAMLGQSESSKAKELGVIVKADTHGSVEAIKASLVKLDHEKVKTRVIHSAVGSITETDVTLAEASGALILGFNVRPDRVAAAAAERKGVQVQCFGIIYELIDTVQAAMVGKLAPIKSEKVQGHAEVRTLFSVPKIGVVAGTAVTDGKITRNSHMRIVRDGIVIYTGRVSSLRRFKDDAKEVVQGFECGIGVENYNDLKVGDVLESFIIEETAPTLN